MRDLRLAPLHSEVEWYDDCSGNRCFLCCMCRVHHVWCVTQIFILFRFCRCIQLDDLSSYAGTIPANGEEEMVLVFEVPDSVSQMGSMELIMRDQSGENTLMLQ